MTVSGNTVAKWVGLALGLGLAVALLATWRVPATSGTLGADVKFVATAPGELTLKPSGAFLQAHGLAAGRGRVSGRLVIRNITARRLAVRVRLLPSAPDLDRALRVELEHGGERLGTGRLGEHRRWSPRAIDLAPGQERSLEASASIAPDAGDYEGRIVDVTVELRARPVKR